MSIRGVTRGGTNLYKTVNAIEEEKNIMAKYIINFFTFCHIWVIFPPVGFFLGNFTDVGFDELDFAKEVLFLVILQKYYSIHLKP
jgi:hypothetical protein